jgi:DNA polymerase-1
MTDTLRSCIAAEKGYSFISLDASQIELRVLAILSQDPQMLEDLKTGDLHQATADRMGASRYDAKQGNFATVYGADEYKLAQMLNVSEDEARAFQQEHRVTYPRLYQWMDEQVAKAKEAGYVISMFGRIRPLPELTGGTWRVREKAEREVVNTIVQGTAVDIVKLAGLYLRAMLDSRVRFLLQIHDEWLLECPDELLQQTLQVCHTLKQVFPDYPFSLAVGKIYNQLKEVNGN